MIKKLPQKSSGKNKILLQPPKGMRDILTDEQPYWEKIRHTVYKIAESFGFLRIDTPILERAEIFERTGEATDIVEKQMFFVKSRGDEHDQLVLKPEQTASIMRAYLQYNLARVSHLLKLFYISPVFRYEQPQAGRFRQHHQAGVEIFGASGAVYDATVILIFYRLLEDLKIKNLIIQINSIGCRNCRPAYTKSLQEYYKKHVNEICADCRQRLAVRPLRLLDCKKEKCSLIKADAPIIVDKLCKNCKRHFQETLEYLDELNLPYLINNYLVRGLDYYNGPVFEIFSEMKTETGDSFFSPALAAGGRYDYLAEMLGNNKVLAVGGAMGIERVIETMKSQGIVLAPKKPVDVFLIHIGDVAKKKNFLIFEELRRTGVRVEESFEKDSLKAQLKLANKIGASLALILGQREVFEESIIIRNMKTGSQESVPLEKVVEEVRKRI